MERPGTSTDPPNQAGLERGIADIPLESVEMVKAQTKANEKHMSDQGSRALAQFKGTIHSQNRVRVSIVKYRRYDPQNGGQAKIGLVLRFVFQRSGGYHISGADIKVRILPVSNGTVPEIWKISPIQRIESGQVVSVKKTGYYKINPSVMVTYAGATGQATFGEIGEGSEYAYESRAQIEGSKSAKRIGDAPNLVDNLAQWNIQENPAHDGVPHQFPVYVILHDDTPFNMEISVSANLHCSRFLEGIIGQARFTGIGGTKLIPNIDPKGFDDRLRKEPSPGTQEEDQAYFDELLADCLQSKLIAQFKSGGAGNAAK